MSLHAVRDGFDDSELQDLDRTEILNSVASLRRELNAMATDIRSVISENVRLRDELEEIRDHRHSARPVSEVHRIKSEIDQLIQMHETVSAGRSRPPRDSYRQPANGNGSEDKSAWMKKMMMFMMMAELM